MATRAGRFATVGDWILHQSIRDGCTIHIALTADKLLVKERRCA
ncbi:hypothetical protein [Rivibacter subsaxonicus]|nr:hypothetical protein [Rivibacter subsaxonicus]